MMQARELRQKYIEFFQSKGHLLLPGSPLPPIDALGNPDTSTLFTTAGMQQFKPYFTGAATPPNGRIVTVQKCVRTNDIDSVGDTSHCTFFEMLGNFSFGDYFKADVIPWTWEFLTSLGIDMERICVTVFEDDAEAYAVWHNLVGLPDERIHRLGADKNFWPANAIIEGPNGPCGPCSEIFYRVAPLEEMTTDPALTPTERYLVDDAAGRWLEIWNNVFTQFDRGEDENGAPKLTPLPKKNNDTGAGFDRIAYVIQGKKSVFETDLFAPIIDRIAELSGETYGATMSATDFAFRVVAEHTRSMVFCIADGILPSNEGRGYVLRYIMRRAIRYGKMVLGFDAPFLHEIAPKVIEQMGDFYTELRERQELILRTVRDEEERFRRTLDNGMARLFEILETPAVQETKILPGREAFTLYDTFGFPIKLTEELAAERGVMLDRVAFEEALEEARLTSKIAAGDREVFGVRDSLASLLEGLPKTEFVGYTELYTEARILAILKNGESVEAAEQGDEVQVIFDKTPFYAQSGGQIGDAGNINALDGQHGPGLQGLVQDTQKSGMVYIHTTFISQGRMEVGLMIAAKVDELRRQNIRRNHTATHLLQATLQEVLGGHVHQKGSLVSYDRLRFDFTHSQPVTPDELKQVEEIVNRQIWNGIPVTVHTDLPIAEAKARGAMALFGEKYGDKVRMIEVPEFSLELCGGTHVENTAQIGLFKIISESGVSAGVRRIEAITGRFVYDLITRYEEAQEKDAHLLKTKPPYLTLAIEKIVAENSQLKQQIKTLKAGGSATASQELEARDVNGVPLVTQRFDGMDAETLANLADRTAQKLGSAVIVLGSVQDGKVLLAAKVTKDLVAKGFHAGNIIREVAKITGGGGGGRPDFATAGGRDPEKLQDALDAVAGMLS